MSAQQPKPGAPVVGFNHNLNYKGRVFHVQTEDSGAQHGHIITHLFLGGNILASTKSSYADLLSTIDPGDLFATVRRLMEEQHKGMMKSLVQGAHDAEIARRTSGPVYEPGVLADGERAPGLLVGGDQRPSVPPQAAAPAAKAPATPGPRTPPPRPAGTPSSLASSLPRIAQRPLATGVPPSPPVMVPRELSMATPVPPPRAPVIAPAGRAPAGSGRGLDSAAGKGWDEVILSYLSQDSDSLKR